MMLQTSSPLDNNPRDNESMESAIRMLVQSADYRAQIMLWPLIYF